LWPSICGPGALGRGPQTPEGEPRGQDKVPWGAPGVQYKAGGKRARPGARAKVVLGHPQFPYGVNQGAQTKGCGRLELVKVRVGIPKGKPRGDP